MGFLNDILKALAVDGVKKLKGPADQKLTHHIITYKTNAVYIDRTKAELPFIVNQVEGMFQQDGLDAVYFNA